MSSAPGRQADARDVANPGRERILARIANALKHKVPAIPVERKPVFAPVEDLLRRFEAECRSNLTECMVCDGNVRARLEQVLAAVPAGEIFAEDTPEFRELLKGVGRTVKWSSEGRASETAQATITRAEALIALTGSLLVSSACGGRGATVVAPVHIVVAHERQLLEDITAALHFANAEQMPHKHSFVGLITGCSRTGDIEKLLVIGAHGPKRLVVLLEKK